MKAILNVNIIDTEIYPGYLLFENDLIVAVGKGNPELPPDAEVIDGEGMYLSAGFIDLHTHGNFGDDFMDADPQAYVRIAVHALAHGATTLYPTTLTCDLTMLKRVFDAFEKSLKSPVLRARTPGINMEGPYIALSQKGAQPDDAVMLSYTEENTDAILSLSPYICRMSEAPELPGAEILSRKAAERGILLSLAHSDANCRQAERGIELGFTHFTHLYSGMAGVNRVHGIRIAGAVEAAYLHDEATVECICDGMHLPYELLRLAYKIKGPDRMALITDSVRPAGLGEGVFDQTLDGKTKITVRDGVAWLPSFEAFAGSVATADILLQTAVKAGIPLIDAVKMLTLTPANIMHLTDRGVLQTGKLADMVLFDKDLIVRKVFLGGKEFKSVL